MLLVLCFSIFAVLVQGSSAGVVACYFPNWAYSYGGNAQFNVDNIDPQLCTHLIYAFAVLNPTTLTIEPYDNNFDIVDGNYYKFTGLKSQNSNLKTLISMGGWTDSQDSYKYSELVNSDTNRKNFANSALAFLQQYGFDGLDIDWEYPSSSDRDGFTQLIAELKSVFSPYGYLVTAAVSGSSYTAGYAYDIPGLNQYIDYFNLMTYDYYGNWDTTSANYVAALYPDVNYGVNFWLQNGASANKLVLGIPTYGPSWTLSTSDTVPPAPADGLGPGQLSAGTMDYWETCADVKWNGWTQVEDVNAEAYAYNLPYWTSYDTPAVSNNKGVYARNMGMAGVMFWDLSSDDFLNTCGEGYSPVIRGGRSGFCNSETGPC